MKKIRSINTEEYGFASLVVAFILILVMSLLTVGFAQLARREQQTALDQQLTNQAYYAAETGINQIKAQLPALKTAYAADPTNPALNGSECVTSSDVATVPALQLNNQINSTNGVSYTCALVNMAPKTPSIPDTSGTGVGNYIFSTTGAMPSLIFSWGSNAVPINNTPAASSCGGAGCFLPASQWYAKNWAPVIQVSITPLTSVISPGQFSRTDLLKNTFTAVLYPSKGTTVGPGATDAYGTPGSALTCPATTPALSVGNITYAPDSGYPDDYNCNDQIVGASYTNGAAYPFSVSINGLGGTAGESWLVHYAYAYGGVNTCIQAFAVGTAGPCIYTNTTSPTATGFADSLVQVDVTGKAKDVEKRILEYLPASSGTSTSDTTQNGISTLPPYAVNGGDICKQFSTNPSNPGTGSPEVTNYAAGSTGSAACVLGP